MLKSILLCTFAFVIVSVSSALATAGTVVLNDPDLMDCQLLKDPAYFQCNLYYDHVLIYEGPDRAPAAAGADCLVCKNVRAAAKAQHAVILLDRDLGWDDDAFLTLSGNP